MDRQQTLQSNNRGRQLSISVARYLRRFLLASVLFALCLTGAAYAQEECLVECLQQLAECLSQGQGDPLASTICQDRYDACWAACIGF
jgi:hypothetical protein